MNDVETATEPTAPPELPPGSENLHLPGLPVNVTAPASITLHLIEDQELDKLTSVSRPLYLGLATTALGGALGLIPSILDALDRLAVNKVKVGDFVVLLTCGACVAVAISCGFVAAQALTDARVMKAEIRSRKLRPYA